VRRRDDLTWQRGELDQLMAGGRQLTAATDAVQ
jgi:hypothetical protein